MKHPKTILSLQVNRNGTYVLMYNGKICPTEENPSFEFDAQIMRVLMTDDNAFNLFQRLVVPVIRARRRNARRSNHAVSPSGPPTGANEVRPVGRAEASAAPMNAKETERSVNAVD